MHKHILRTLIFVTGLIMIRPVAAIDGDYGVPYAADQDSTQSGNGTAMTDSNYGRKNLELPMSTIVGGILVLLGAGGALYWQMKPGRGRQVG